MKNYAKFHGYTPRGQKAKRNLARAIELSETANFVSSFVEKPYTDEQL